MPSGGNGNGGKRPGAGRPKGALGKRTMLIANARAANPKRMPLDYLLDLMRAPYPKGATALRKVQIDELRFEAAKAAAPYVHPRLTSVDVGNKSGEKLIVEIVNYAPRETPGKPPT